MDRTALVTGGTRGLGLAICTALSGAGYRVAATYRSDAQAAHAVAECYGIAVFQWDVADEAACARGVAAVQERLGPVDVLVNNAGITADGMFHKMQLAQWHAVLQTNL